METKHLGKQSLKFARPAGIVAAASAVGPMEGKGPLRDHFDYISDDSRFGQKSWEAGESTMLQKACALALEKADLQAHELDFILSGDLLNQCTASAYAMRDSHVPYFGLYGACSTMGESLLLSAILLDGGFADTVMAATSSHFCSSERQFRMPLAYGSQRSPTAQWTVTGAGAVILRPDAPAPYITHATVGRICDAGVTNMTNMGAAMAPAAYSTLTAHFEDTGRGPDFYDAIVTGDLGVVGSDLLRELFRRDGIELGEKYTDCGRLIYDLESQDAHAGGSGCGCSASVLCGHLLDGMHDGRWKKLLFAPTGALMSPTMNQQGESIPSICHALSLETEKV